jgi:hypothetical protein
VYVKPPVGPARSRQRILGRFARVFIPPSDQEIPSLTNLVPADGRFDVVPL